MTFISLFVENCLLNITIHGFSVWLIRTCCDLQRTIIGFEAMQQENMIPYLIRNKTGASKAAGTTHPVQPFCPLGVQASVGLLVLGLKHSDGLALRVLHKVATRRTLKHDYDRFKFQFSVE